MSSTKATGLRERVGSFRWTIGGLLFAASTINYIDRQVIGILKPTLQQQFGWSELDYGDIVFSFTFAYAIGYVFAGWLMDQLGSKKGYALAVVVWSLAAMAHADVAWYGGSVSAMLALGGLKYSMSVAGFLAARFVLGLGESGSFPAAIKAVAEWFPMRERAFATGVFNAGTNVGAIVTPLVIPWVTVAFGWRWAFLATGALGFVWLAFWWLVYDTPQEHHRVGGPELAHISSDLDLPVTRARWAALLPHRQTWAFAIAKFLTDSIWWLYLFWIPDFFTRAHGLPLTGIGPPIIAIYLVADVGSVGGGWFSSALIRRGWTVNAGRKTAMLTCALLAIPVVMAARVEGTWSAVAIIGLAAAAHQGWSANLFTLASDMFPRPSVGSIVGIGGTAGAVGGMCLAKATGAILQVTGSYVLVFVIPAVTYTVALVVLQLLAPRLTPVRLET